LTFGKERDLDHTGFSTDRSGGSLRSESLGDSEPFSRVGKPEPWDESGEPAELRQLKAVLLGPPASGKSSFVAALQQGLIVDPSDVLRRCVPQGASTSLANRASRAVQAGERLAEPSEETDAYSFQVEVTQPPVTIELVIYDGGGDRVFSPTNSGTSSFDSTWLAQAQSAQILVLCVDSKAPQPAYWQSALSQLVEDLAKRQEDLRATRGLPGILHPPQFNSAGARCLPFGRVLFLLSRIDLLIETALAQQNGFGYLRRLAGVEPRSLGRTLDPAPQLCALLGTGTVGRFLHAMPEGAEIAVGVVSARGFGSITDEPDAEGKGLISSDISLADWCPFGIREALEFLMTGEYSDPVVSLSKRDLRQRSLLRL
jgi:GTPase SAR1 family protein